ncbi:MAG: LysR family transcriptional regulator [Candidatus Hydrogenedentes bacterium]|nr:LysR family transcriptional regulator [Candidatus Hydrogenedentota bacterium]
MTLDSLRCFCAVVDSGSFRAAAERVHRSQPAVSQQIKALERETGHVLLERATCKLTPSGAALYTRASRLLADADALSRELRDFDESRVRELRLGTSDTTALYVLPPIVRQFARALPQTRLVIVNRPTEAVADQVARGDLDLGIVTLPVRRAELEEQELFKQNLALVVPKQSPIAKRRSVILADLKDESFLLLDEHTRTGMLLREHFREQGFDPQIVLDSGSFEVIKRYVAEGIGISFLPRNVISGSDRQLALVNVSGLPQVTIGVIRRRGAYRTFAEKAFCDLLR